MNKLRTHADGFTVIELLVFIIVLMAVAVVGISNIRTLRAQNRDTVSKTDINALYYQLESFYEKNGYYPEKIDATTLKGVDPESLKDRAGLTVGKDSTLYTYKPAACAETKCKSFTLNAQLEKEAPFVRVSLNK